MASPSHATKRAKLSPITTLDNIKFNEKDVAESNTHTKMTFQCPVTIDNVFSAPTPAQVQIFYESRTGSSGKPFSNLPKGE